MCYVCGQRVLSLASLPEHLAKCERRFDAAERLEPNVARRRRRPPRAEQPNRGVLPTRAGDDAGFRRWNREAKEAAPRESSRHGRYSPRSEERR